MSGRLCEKPGFPPGLMWRTSKRKICAKNCNNILTLTGFSSVCIPSRKFYLQIVISVSPVVKINTLYFCGILVFTFSCIYIKYRLHPINFGEIYSTIESVALPQKSRCTVLKWNSVYLYSSSNSQGWCMYVKLGHIINYTIIKYWTMCGARTSIRTLTFTYSFPTWRKYRVL